MRLTVLGSSGGYAGPGRACSGYLLQDGDDNAVLDLGFGALANLLGHVPADGLGAVILSHTHHDHFTDIYGLCTARRFWERELPPLPLLAPAGAFEVIMCSVNEGSRRDFARALDVTVAVPGTAVNVAGFEVLAQPAEHSAGSLIYRITRGGGTVCYSGDTDVCDALLEQARGADLFVCEATFTGEVPEKMPGHLFASEAGEVAAKAGVRTLMLTHLWPTLSRERVLEDAASRFDGRILMADEGLAVEV